MIMTTTRSPAETVTVTARTPHPLRALVSRPDGIDDARHVVQAWVASRGFMLLIAALYALTQGRSMWDMVNNWDAALYRELAYNGYFSDPRGTLMAFFPAFSSLLRLGVDVGVPTQVTGMVISAIGSALAAAALYRMGGRWAAIAWLFAPTAVFTLVPYTESIFCAVAFWAWERARVDKWMAASVLACITCTVRVSGVFLLGALAVSIITSWAEPGAERRDWRIEVRIRAPRLLWLLPGIAAIFAYSYFLYRLTGSWTAWYDAQATGWVRGFTWPWESAMNTWQVVKPGAYPDHPEWAPVFRLEVISMAMGLLATGWCLGRRKWAEASWVGVQVLAFSLSYWFFSVNRAVLLWFPLWLMLAELGQYAPKSITRRSLWQGLVVLVCAAAVLAMVWWCTLFYTGRWSS